MRVRNRSTVPPSGFGASDIQPIGHQYRPTVDFIPSPLIRNRTGRVSVSPSVQLREAVTMLQQDRRDFLKLAGVAAGSPPAPLSPPQGRCGLAGAAVPFLTQSGTHSARTGPR